MKKLIMLAALGQLSSLGLFSADVAYQESFGAGLGSYDFPWQVLGDPSNFFHADYTPAPFDASAATTYNVFIKGNRMARIGIVTSTIYDLDAGTLTIIRHDKRAYEVLKFKEANKLVTKETVQGAKISIVIHETGRTDQIAGQEAAEYAASVFSGSQEPSHIVAHAVFGQVRSLPVKELADYETSAFRNTQVSMRGSVR